VAVKRVLVTGATGFVGRACIGPLQQRGYCVHTISSSRGSVPDGVTVWPGSLLDTGRIGALLAQIAPTHLLHLAWDVARPDYWSSSANLDWLAAGITLLRAFHAVGGQRAVGVGTCAEYGWTVERYAEFEAPLEPATRYGMTKLALCRAFQATGQLGVSTAWARLFFPFGPGERPTRVLPSVVTSLIAGREAACTVGTQVRDFLYIEDVGAALAALLDSQVEGPVNVGSGRGVALREVILRAAEELGRPDLVRLGALPLRSDDAPSLVAGTERLNREVGFVPSIPLGEGIRRTIDYWARTKAPGTVEDCPA
jgi:nucleoside-diphosphate-sugar epimerase